MKFLLPCYLATLSVLPSHAEDWPMVADSALPSGVLTAQVDRLAQAMEKAGPAWSAERIAKMKRSAAAWQEAMDSECFAALQIGRDGKMGLITAARPVLNEQGWRTLFLKVVNAAGGQNTLRLQSPNVRPIPGSEPEDVLRQWLDADIMERSPLSPNLNGAALEYRPVHLWAREAGRHRASFSVNLGVPLSQPALLNWSFERELQGWEGNADGRVDLANGAMHIHVQGADPILTCRVKVDPGEKQLRFRARNGSNPAWQVFWWTDKMSGPDGDHMRNISVFKDDGGWNDYSVSFTADAPLAALRIDPGTGTGECYLDDLELVSLSPPGPETASAEVVFEVEASHQVRFQVKDENGRPAMAAFTIRDTAGRLYPWPAKRVAPDFFFQSQIYRGDGESVLLPTGSYQVTCQRGPESVPEKKLLDVPGVAIVRELPGSASAAAAPAALAYRVKRWIDPSLSGWYSGDHHIHAAGCQHYAKPTEGVFPKDMQRHIMGEDLKIGCNLTWGPCFDFQKQFFTGRIDQVSQYPYLLRYDVEVSGFGSHQSGHLCLLRLKEQIFPGGDSKHHWPTLGLNTLRWAKAQGAITGPAHSASGLHGDVGRIPAAQDGPGGLPNFTIPDFRNGIGANEYVVDITHEVPGPTGRPVPAVDFISTMDTDRQAELNMWYHTLNAGFVVRASGETDFPCITGHRVGGGRVYVFQREKRLEFDDWCAGLQEGRSYVSDGTAHLLDFKVGSVSLSSGRPDLALEKGEKLPVTCRGAIFSAEHQRAATVELIINGFPAGQQELPADGVTRDLKFEADITSSSWVALRIFPHVHTNPVFVTVSGQPIRRKHSLQWLRRCVDQAWIMNERTYRPDELSAAREAYDHARKVYEDRLKEARD